MKSAKDYAALAKERALALARDTGAAESIHGQLDAARVLVREAAKEVGLLETVQLLALRLEADWRKSYEAHVADTCSEGVSLVFGESLEVNVISSTKAGASAVRFALDAGNGDTDIMSAEGRSLREVIAFLLRVITISEARPAMLHFLTLDEEFGGVSEENVPAVATLLRKLVDEGDQQLLFVTHNRSFADMADRVYEVQKNGSEGVVKLLRDRADNHLYV